MTTNMSGLLASACEAEESFSDDELERHAAKMKRMPPVDDWEHKDLCKGRKKEAAHSYQLRTDCSTEDAFAVIEYWYNLTFSK